MREPEPCLPYTVNRIYSRARRWRTPPTCHTFLVLYREFLFISLLFGTPRHIVEFDAELEAQQLELFLRVGLAQALVEVVSVQRRSASFAAAAWLRFWRAM